MQRPRIAVVFYHPKNVKNVVDIATICRDVGAELLVVPRPGAERELKRLAEVYSFTLVNDVAEAREKLEGFDVLVLETYGYLTLDEVLRGCVPSVAIVVGAEDYGIPKSEVEKLGEVKVVRIPMAVEGTSFNVASTVVVALYEVVKACRG